MSAVEVTADLAVPLTVGLGAHTGWGFEPADSITPSQRSFGCDRRPRNRCRHRLRRNLRPLSIETRVPRSRKLDSRGSMQKNPRRRGVKFGRATRCQARRKMDYAMIRRIVVHHPMPLLKFITSLQPNREVSWRKRLPNGNDDSWSTDQIWRVYFRAARRPSAAMLRRRRKIDLGIIMQ
jgi:hypothetical protein